MTDKPESETTDGLSVGEVLPVVAYRLSRSGWMTTEPTVGWTDLTPHAPAQATVAAQAAEIERLKGEKAELSYEFGAAMHRCSLTIDRLTRELAEARQETRDWRKQHHELKAKQVADIDEVMRLADKYAEAERTQHNYSDKTRSDAAREALRSALAVQHLKD